MYRSCRILEGRLGSYWGERPHASCFSAIDVELWVLRIEGCSPYIEVEGLKYILCVYEERRAAWRMAPPP